MYALTQISSDPGTAQVLQFL